MNVNDVHRGIRKFKKARRVGRGVGSGRGKTCGRGHKGQKSNPGYSALPIFQGGTMPLVRRIPKRGFNNPFALVVAAVNVGDLERVFSPGDEVTPEAIKKRSLVKGTYEVLKILGDGELTKRLKVSAHRFSQSAKEKIEKAGGKADVIVVPPKVTPQQRKAEEKKAAAAAKKA